MPSMSPIVVVITVCISVLESIFSRLYAKFSTIIIAFAPESLYWCNISSEVYNGLVLTITNPALRQANMATGYCNKFGIWSATLSPFFKLVLF